MLHWFEYENARLAFTEISEADPQCAMAQWGVAMSDYHGLWGNGDTAAGRVALNKAREIASANTKTTPREAAHIDALAEIYGEDGNAASDHSQAFEQKMGALKAAYPDDDEAAIFYALTLDITAPKGDKRYANQRKCGEILEPIFARQPHRCRALHHSLL